MSLKQYLLTTCSELKSMKKRKLDGLENVNQIMKNKEYKQEIMPPVELNCTPCFPISTGKNLVLYFNIHTCQNNVVTFGIQMIKSVVLYQLETLHRNCHVM